MRTLVHELLALFGFYAFAADGYAAGKRNVPLRRFYAGTLVWIVGAAALMFIAPFIWPEV